MKSFDRFSERLRETVAQLPPPKPADEVEAEQRAKIQQERTRLWGDVAARIGKRFRDCHIEPTGKGSFIATDEAQKRALTALEAFSREMSGETRAGFGLLILGPSGRGKDHLLVGMIRRAVFWHGLSVMWVNGLDLFGLFRDWMNSSRNEKELISDFLKPDILAISDPIPPSGTLTDYQATMLQRIVDTRYRELKPVWVTCNASSQKDAASKIGVPVVDRLSDNALVIRADWPSHRKTHEVV